MDINENLILIKGEDKTESITECKINLGEFIVTFKDNNIIKYEAYNIEWLKVRKEILGDSIKVFVRNEEIKNICRIMDFNKYLKIYFTTGNSKIYTVRNVRIDYK